MTKHKIIVDQMALLVLIPDSTDLRPGLIASCIFIIEPLEMNESSVCSNLHPF